jgi:molybdopterin-containing oxidoreductase family membrane subunit
LLNFQMHGGLAPYWYTMLFFNILVPLLTLWNKRVRRSPIALFLITIGINIGMYLERFVIIPGFLQRSRMPFNWGEYTPRLPELLSLSARWPVHLAPLLASKVIR